MIQMIAPIVLFFENISDLFKLFNILILQRYFCFTELSTLVGAAFSREYCSSTVLPSFIAAKSRSHKLETVLMSYGVIEVLD